MWKKTISFLVWCHVKVQLKRSHLNGDTCFSSRYHYFFRSQWSLWVLLILEFKMVSYIVLLIGIMIHRSPVSLVLVVLRRWFMYLWRISKPRRTTCTRTRITGRAMRNTNHENQENQA